jgi:serine protease Do
LLKFDVPAGNNTTTRIVYVKNFPKVSSPSGTTGPQSNTPPQKSWTGSGFLISEGGLVATNFHVAGTATTLKLTFPKIGKEFTGKLLLKDPNNDLAIIKIDNFSLADISQTSIPYGYKKTKAVSMGDQIFTIGYPLSPLLGQNPKFTNGTISSKSGMGDDMVHLQINAAIQPGNSGSPLFDENGNIVGIIVASLNAEWMRGRFGSIPQNVNFAIKSEYLFNLAEMLPVTIKMNEVAQKISPEAIAPFVCLISAQ